MYAFNYFVFRRYLSGEKTGSIIFYCPLGSFKTKNINQLIINNLKNQKDDYKKNDNYPVCCTV